MKCPKCEAWTRVLGTRGTVRQRECANGHRFSTVETVIENRRHGGDRRSKEARNATHP